MLTGLKSEVYEIVEKSHHNNNSKSNVRSNNDADGDDDKIMSIYVWTFLNEL